MTKIASILATGTAFMLLSGCGPSDENNENHANHNSSGEVIVPETYTYESRFVDGESAVRAREWVDGSRAHVEGGGG